LKTSHTGTGFLGTEQGTAHIDITADLPPVEKEIVGGGTGLLAAAQLLLRKKAGASIPTK
jgi:hypothetical protein